MEKKPRVAGQGPRWWIRHQGSEVRLIQSDAAPSDEAREGERAVRLLGPFRDEDKARKMSERLERRTTRWQSENEGRA